MSLYVFLRTGRRASLSELQWPAPNNGQAGAWLAVDRDGTAGAVRAYPVEELLWCLDDELWEAELDGARRREGHAFVAERGRLLKRIHAWSPEVASELVEACAFRVRDAAVDELTRAGLASEARDLGNCVSLDAIEQLGAAIAQEETEPARRLAGFASDTALYARESPDPVRAAACAAYVAAHALAGGDKTVTSYEADFADERRWQAEWLTGRLRLQTGSKHRSRSIRPDG